MNLKLNQPNTSKRIAWIRYSTRYSICRTEKNSIRKQDKKGILFCNLSLESVIMVENARSIYEVPPKLYKEGN